MSFLLACLLCLGSAAAFAPAAAPDLSVTIRSDALNSAAQVYTAAGALAKNGLLGKNWTTASLKAFLPKAYEACPDCPLGYQLLVVTPPVSDLTEASATAHVSGAILNLTAGPKGSPVQNLLLGLSLNASVGLSFSNVPAASGDFIKVKVGSTPTLHFDVVESALGPLPTGIINNLAPILNLIIRSFVVPYFNNVFPGFPLPALSGFKITGAAFATHQDSVGVSLNIAPTPHAFQQGPAALAAALMPASIIRSLPPGFSGPGVIVTVGGSGLTKVLQGLVPDLVKAVNGMVIPAMSGQASGVSYTVNAIALSGFAIGSATISFASGQGLVLKLGGLSLNVPSTGFKIQKKIKIGPIHKKVHCSGHMSGSLSGASVSEAVNITAVKGSPHITQASGNWNFGSLSVHEKMDHTACKVIQNIASWFTGNINKLIQKQIVAMVPKAVDGIIASGGNKALAQLVTTKRVDKWAAVNFYLTQDPTSASNALEIDLSGQFVKASQGPADTAGFASNEVASSNQRQVIIY